MLRKALDTTIIFVAAILGVLILFTRSCSRPPEPISTSPLPENIELEVRTAPNKIEVKTNKETVTKYVPRAGGAAVTVDTKGNVDLRVRNKGFSFSPGLGLLVSRDVYVAIDTQLLYWNRFGAHVGFGASIPQLDPVGFVAGSYTLDQLGLDNTALFLAYTTKKEVGGGLRVRF